MIDIGIQYPNPESRKNPNPEEHCPSPVKTI
jgi:hypothetical protein